MSVPLCKWQTKASRRPLRTPITSRPGPIHFVGFLTLSLEQASACCKHYVANEMEGTTQKDGEHLGCSLHWVSGSCRQLQCFLPLHNVVVREDSDNTQSYC